MNCTCADDSHAPQVLLCIEEGHLAHLAGLEGPSRPQRQHGPRCGGEQHLGVKVTKAQKSWVIDSGLYNLPARIRWEDTGEHQPYITFMAPLSKILGCQSTFWSEVQSRPQERNLEHY